ncbi:MAG: sugar ABC transporter permease [Treponema sp.]|nr:sugar ABC transporter permease [Treponema sp.]
MSQGFRRGEAAEAALLLAPLLVLLLVFILVPVLANFAFSFTDYDGLSSPVFAGLRNFIHLFKDPSFAASLRNVGVLCLYIPVGLFVPLLLAAMLREGVAGWKIYRAIFYLPQMLGITILGVLFQILLRDNGPVNALFDGLGLGFLSQRWIMSTGLAIHTTAFLLVVWLKIGFGLIFFLSSMNGVSESLYEAARLDGAGWWRIFFNITIPSIRSAIEFWIVFLFIEVFARTFGFIYTLTYGGPGYSTYTMEFGVYFNAFKNYQLGYASAWSVVLFFMCALVALLQVVIKRREE